MAQVLETAERLWSGKASTRDMSPVTAFLGLEQVADGLAFLSSFGNVIVLDTSAGLVLFDTGSFFLAQNNYAHIRDWSTRTSATGVRAKFTPPCTPTGMWTTLLVCRPLRPSLGPRSKSSRTPACAHASSATS